LTGARLFPSSLQRVDVGHLGVFPPPFFSSPPSFANREHESLRDSAFPFLFFPTVPNGFSKCLPFSPLGVWQPAQFRDWVSPLFPLSKVAEGWRAPASLLPLFLSSLWRFQQERPVVKRFYDNNALKGSSFAGTFFLFFFSIAMAYLNMR